MKLDNAAIKNNLKECLGLDAATSKIVVVGLGVTGISVVRYLVDLDFKFVIADSRPEAQLTEIQREEFGNIVAFSGVFDELLFSNATHLIVSPGVALTEKAIVNAVCNGTKIVGDIDLFVCSIAKPDASVIAITGSNGKSTVTTMVGEMLSAANIKAGVGGNLGVPALDLLQYSAEFYVLELSSFQLERTEHLNAVAATVLNVTADHLDRHADITDYAAQKQKVFLGSGTMVINIDDLMVSAMQSEARNAITFSIVKKADFHIAKVDNSEILMHEDKQLMPLSELPLEGRHNAANALAALALGVAVGLNAQIMCNVLRKFKGLAHRMQRVAEIAGVTWVNDSKATNIGACVAALQGYEKRVILIAGGDAKGADMNELVPVVKEKAKSVVLMGKDASLIEQALNGCVPIYKAADMKQAVSIAASVAQAGESVLLSPACASLDQYKNYQERGDKFTKAVLGLVA